jgi:hypothetical protein
MGTMAGRLKYVATAGLGSCLLAACGFGITGPATNVTDVGAQLSARVGNTNPEATAWWFEYGPTAAYGAATPHGSVSVGSASSQYAVNALVSGLSDGTTYHYRVCTSGTDGRGSCGEDATFSTTTGHDSVTGSGVILDLGFGYVLGGQALAIGDTAEAGSATGRAAISPGSVYFKIADGGAVTCLHVAGNRAAVGFVADAVDLGQPDPAPIPRVLYIEDNGASGDRIGFGGLNAPYTSCPAPTAADFVDFTVGDSVIPPVLESGDFTIHDHPSD